MNSESTKARSVRLGRRLRLAVLALLVVSLIPLPLTPETAAQAGPGDRTPPPPPAKAVRFLERLRESDAKPRPAAKATQRQANRNAKPGAKANKQRQVRRGPRARRINRQGCVFLARGNLWTLVRNCAPRGTIVIPNGITLNGQNRALIVTGNIAKFDGAVVASGYGRANLRNLRIEGNAGLTGQCQDLGTGVLFFYASGTISNVIVRNIELGPSGCPEDSGIYAIGDKRVNILNSTVHNAGSTGMILQGLVSSTIAGNTLLIASRQVASSASGILISNTRNSVVRDNDFRLGGDDAAFGVVATVDVNLTIANNRFQNLYDGISASGGIDPASLVIRDNQLTGIIDVGIGVSNATVQVLRNSVTGVTPGLGADGLNLLGGSTGVANNNAIANFDCGITDTSGVTLGAGAQANTFANNTQDVCP